MASQKDGIEIFDRLLLRKIRSRRAADLKNAAFLIDWAAKTLAERLSDIKREFQCTLVTGCRINKNILNNLNDIETIISTDISCELLAAHTGPRVQADPELMPFANHSLDLVFSVLDLHSINDLPGALIQIRRALKPDGLFLAAMFGGETLFELRDSLTRAEIELKGGASPRVFPFADKQQMGALMQRAGFALPVIDSEILTVTYGDMMKLLADLRHMSEGNIIRGRDKKFTGKRYFTAAEKYYREHFTDKDGRLTASFEIIFLIGWAPHESQPKPLKPGSAQNKLADALATGEFKLS
ncbi:MAG: methyltransferase domain-containing protein [Alphaproteobacteria bacterium]